MSKKKVIPFSKIVAICSSLRRKKKTLVFTNGCFDIIHAGHVKYLEKAKAFGDALVVGLNSDSSVKRIKGSFRPVVAQADRATILAGLEAVDYVVIFDETTPAALIKAVRPDVLVKGGDWKVSSIVGADFVKSYGGRIKSVPLVRGRSTSNLIQAITERFK